MTALRALAGLLAGVVMAASSYAHSVLGWPQLRAQLAQHNVPADLAKGLGVGWVFGGVCMLGYGLVALWMFSQAWRAVPVALAPARLIGLTYLAFGIGAMVVNGGDPFYVVFIVPALLLLYASLGSGAPRRRR